MGLISKLYNFSSGNTIRSSEINAEFNQILDLNNGNLDRANFSRDFKAEIDNMVKRVHILKQDNKLLSLGIVNASNRISKLEHKYDKIKKAFE